MAKSRKEQIDEWLEDEEFSDLEKIVKMGRPAAEHLASVYSTSRDRFLRHRALIALARIGGDNATGALESGLRSRDPVLRVHAMQALRQNPALLDEAPELVDGVARTLRVTDDSARLNAARTLAEVLPAMDHRPAVRALERASADDSSPLVREASAAALSGLLQSSPPEDGDRG